MTSIINPQPNETADYNNSPNCWQCRHFAISWEPATPYMCSLMGFKSRLMPSIEVLRADGRICRGFMAKSVQGLPNQTPSSAQKVSANKTHSASMSQGGTLSALLNTSRINGGHSGQSGHGVTSTSKSGWSA